MGLRLSDVPPKEAYQGRFRVTTVLVLILFGLLFGRMWQLQVFDGSKWRRFSDANRIHLKKVKTMRGRVFDRKGQILSETRPSFDLIVTPAYIEGSFEENLKTLTHLMQWQSFDATKIVQRFKVALKYEPMTLKKDIDAEELARFLGRQYVFPGFEIRDQPARSYPMGSEAAHLLGYVGEISPKDIEALTHQGQETVYKSGDVWGISGVEKAFESFLRGTDGVLPVIEDARGRPILDEYATDLLPLFQSQDPIPGNDLYLSIDADLQRIAEEAFGAASGALVAMDPDSGDVLALLSRPQYYPENFTRGVSSKYWKEIYADPLNPLYDRSLRGLYPPGSTFKIFTALAGLEERVMSPSESIYCPGFYRIGREVKKCWLKGGHGSVSFKAGMKGSCDAYFYEMGRRLGIDRIASYAFQYGFGEVSGIGINREKAGLIPTEAWKMKTYKQKWVGGETLSVAIGQGYLQVTPLQLAVGVSALVNGGRVLKPRLALRAAKPDGQTLTSFETHVRKTTSVSEPMQTLVREALVAVVNEPGGTGGRARIKDIMVGGKTGTAQVVGYKSGLDIKDHAWFVAYAPAEAPKIVVAVIAEFGGHGGSTAAPIAKKVIESHLGVVP